ncbi:DUF411 domain-containing protein [Halomonas sp. YLGW01]|uniref:DUF411 domain-containing protein n=1 Tax=Halomonas sp. YLGW01 TaxID=2773308 RepID=UPI0017808882|nr:DUF411 domain-containing protein [Halomonas sp. YLGW01]
MTSSSLRLHLAGVLLAGIALPAWAETPVVDIHKDPACGCCTAWAEHLEAAGFEVRQHETRDMRELKAAHGVSPRLASCHTAVVDGYVIEGHVPAADIRRLLDERPELQGLAVPGMPHGSPGMETGRQDDYAVLGFHDDGRVPSIFTNYSHD